MTEDESALFDYLEYICGNISLDSNSSSNKLNSSLDERLKDKDIDELQYLLKKIELKKSGIQRKLDENNSWVDVSDDESKVKSSKKSVAKVGKTKKVRWGQSTPKSSRSISRPENDEYSDEEDIDLKEPTSGAYSSSLKQQITELENRVSDLKLHSAKKERAANDSINKSNNNVSTLVSDEVTKLKDQIQKLSQRLMSIESKSYDLISPQAKEIRNSKQNIKSKSQYNIERITSPSGPNISVSQNLNDTTVDFPNGDQMKICKDNTMVINL